MNARREKLKQENSWLQAGRGVRAVVEGKRVHLDSRQEPYQAEGTLGGMRLGMLLGMRLGMRLADMVFRLEPGTFRHKGRAPCWLARKAAFERSPKRRAGV